MQIPLSYPFAAASSGMTPWRRMQWLAWTALPLAVLLLGLWLLAQPLSAQLGLFLWLNRQAAALPTALWSCATMLGDTTVLFALMTPLLLWRPQALMASLAAVPLGGLFSVIAKRGFDTPRPAAVLDLDQFQVIGPLLMGHSFPSGHSITAFAAAAAVLATSTPSIRSRRCGALLIAVLALAATVSLSRVAVGAHWPLDLVFGAGGGWLAGLSGALLTRRFPAWWRGARSQGLLAVGLAAASIWLLWRPLDHPQAAPVLWLAAASSWGALLALSWRRLGL